MSVIDEIHCSLTGTSDFTATDELADWLRWRITEGWYKTVIETHATYDAVLRMLAVEVLKAWDAYRLIHS